LFTDLEGSTRLWQEHPEVMQDALARHDEIVREAIGGHGGHVVKTTGDGFHAAFSRSGRAVTTTSASDLYCEPYDVGIDADPYPMFRRLREEAPLTALARLEGRVALEGALMRFPEWEVDTANARLAPTSTVWGLDTLPVFVQKGN
jgi:class 3 adenylate cyclase